MSKQLSIITVCLNEAETIENTLLSVITQNYRNFEYIVIDGGSDDGTLEIISKYKDKIDILISQKDSGIYNAMNKAIELSTGEYLYFLNSGDYLNGSDILERIFHYSPSTDLVYGDIIIQLKPNFFYRRKSPKRIRKTYMAATTIPHQASFIKKSLFRKIGNYDESFIIAADYDFFLKAFFVYKINYQYIPLPWAINQFFGTNSKLINLRTRRSEVERARINCFSKKFIAFFRLFSPIYALFIKYPSFAYFIIMSRISKNFLQKT